MKQLIVLMILICVTLSVWGQPPSVEIITPVSGYYAIVHKEEGLLLIDTQNGFTDYLVTGLTVSNPVWANNSLQIAYFYQGLKVMDILSQTTTSIAHTEYALDIPFTWSPDDSQIFRQVFNPSEERFNLLQLSDQTIHPLFTFRVNEMISDLPIDHIIWEPSTLEFLSFSNASWNPVYSDWILVQLSVYSNDQNTVGSGGYPINIIYDVSTSEMISLDTLMLGTVESTQIRWHQSGRYFFAYSFTDDNNIDLSIIKFDPLTGELSIVQEVQDVVNFFPTHWLGLGDLLLGTGNTELGQTAIYIGQISGGMFQSVEIFKFTDPFIELGGQSWKFTGTPEEAAELSCIFDETLPTRLEIGIQAQVAFTDGTPSRLRSEPSTWGDVVQSLPEGTSFEIIGGYMCGSGYRWWQVQLADGTQGWIAEASETEYWIERRAS